MKDVHDAPKGQLIHKTAEELKKIKEISPPVWAAYAKTGTHKQRPPIKKDWWYTRASSILVKVMDFGPIGVSKLRIKYGGKKRRGHQPAEFRKASGNVIRKILQQLESAELIKKADKSGHKGRILAPKGASILTKAATGK